MLDPELKAGEAYMDGTMVVEQGSIADLLRTANLARERRRSAIAATQAKVGYPPLDRLLALGMSDIGIGCACRTVDARASQQRFKVRQ